MNVCTHVTGMSARYRGAAAITEIPEGFTLLHLVRYLMEIMVVADGHSILGGYALSLSLLIVGHICSRRCIDWRQVNT